MKKEAFEKAHGKIGSNVIYIDLDDPVNQVPPEVVTAGWTDTQIKGKPLVEIEKQIESGELGLAGLRETLSNEERRIAGLRQVRLRKIQLGG